MTTEKGCSESEALTAASLLSQFIESYNITQDEMQIRADAQGCIEDEFFELGFSRSEWTNSCGYIAALFSTRCIFREEFEPDLGVKIIKIAYYGFPLDVAGAVALSAIIANAVHTDGSAFESKVRGSKKKSSSGSSFRIGMADRISERLHHMKWEKDFSRQNSNGTALMVLKDQLVTEEFAKRFPNVGKARQVGNISDSNAYQKGREAGNKVSLSTSNEIKGHKTAGLLS